MARKGEATPSTYSPSPSTYSPSPSTYSPSPTNQKTKSLSFGNDDVLRPDDREWHQCRPAFFQIGVVAAAAGSAYADFGSTKVIVSVFGPRESKKAMMYSDIGRLNCNVSYTTFATPVRGQGSDHKEFSSMLHKALEGAIILETFPKTTVDVFALVLESGGSKYSISFNMSTSVLSGIASLGREGNRMKKRKDQKYRRDNLN